MNADLLIPATAALLDGWRGPVTILDHEGWCEIPVDGVALEADPRGLVLIAYRLGPTDIVREVWMEIEFVVVDCGRAECRDRVGRVMAGLVHPKIAAPGRMTFCGWPARWAFDFEEEEADRANAGGNCGSRPAGLALDDEDDMGKALPAVAALDPLDDTRLPDGSRLVDALALAAVARATFTPGESR